MTKGNAMRTATNSNQRTAWSGRDLPAHGLDIDDVVIHRSGRAIVQSVDWTCESGFVWVRFAHGAEARYCMDELVHVVYR